LEPTTAMALPPLPPSPPALNAAIPAELLPLVVMKPLEFRVIEPPLPPDAPSPPIAAAQNGGTIIGTQRPKPPSPPLPRLLSATIPGLGEPPAVVKMFRLPSNSTPNVVPADPACPLKPCPTNAPPFPLKAPWPSMEIPRVPAPGVMSTVKFCTLSWVVPAGAPTPALWSPWHVTVGPGVQGACPLAGAGSRPSAATTGNAVQAISFGHFHLIRLRN